MHSQQTKKKTVLNKKNTKQTNKQNKTKQKKAMDANVEKFISIKPSPFPCLITNIKIMDAISGQKFEERGIPCKDFESVEKALKH